MTTMLERRTENPPAIFRGRLGNRGGPTGRSEEALRCRSCSSCLREFNLVTIGGTHDITNRLETHVASNEFAYTVEMSSEREQGSK